MKRVVVILHKGLWNRRWLMLFLALVCMGGMSTGQSHTLELILRNQSADAVVLGKLRGDRFIPIDTVEVISLSGPSQSAKAARFPLPGGTAPGVYRLILGYSTYARVTGGSPQQLDILYNGEDIVLATDFKAPADSLEVVQSGENRVWFSFRREEKAYEEQLDLLEQEVDHYQSRVDALKRELEGDGGSTGAGMTPSAAAETATGVATGTAGVPDRLEALRRAKAALAETANTFNRLQMERDRIIAAVVEEHGDLLAGQLAALSREPLRDGYLTPGERNESFRHNYFRYVDFTNTNLMNTPHLTNKIFQYLVTFNRRGYDREQRETAYIRAVDAVMEEVEQATAATDDGVAMYEFILNYLVDGFEKLEMDAVLDHLAATYLERVCTTSDKSTLERRLAAQQMKPGMVVPDFTLPDAEGQPITLSQAAGPHNLILFWSADCPHCLDMLPRIAQWQRQLPKGAVEIFAISLDTSAEVWQAAVRNAGIEFCLNLSDLQAWDGPVAREYHVYATPTMFLVDQERRIIAKPLSVEEIMESF